jgi:hypothetical protein
VPLFRLAGQRTQWPFIPDPAYLFSKKKNWAQHSFPIYSESERSLLLFLGQASIFQTFADNGLLFVCFFCIKMPEARRFIPSFGHIAIPNNA